MNNPTPTPERSAQPNERSPRILVGPDKTLHMIEAAFRITQRTPAQRSANALAAYRRTVRIQMWAGAGIAVLACGLLSWLILRLNG